MRETGRIMQEHSGVPKRFGTPLFVLASKREKEEIGKWNVVLFTSSPVCECDAACMTDRTHGTYMTYITDKRRSTIMKKLISAILAGTLALSLAACGSSASSSTAASSQAAATAESGGDLAGATIRVAASPTPHAEILNVAKEILAGQGVTLEVVEFSDYVQPNMVTGERRSGRELLPATSSTWMLSMRKTAPIW